MLLVVVALLAGLAVARAEQLNEDPKSSAFFPIASVRSPLDSDHHSLDSATPDIFVPFKCMTYTKIDITDTNAVELENSKDPVLCKPNQKMCFRGLFRNKDTKRTLANAGCFDKGHHTLIRGWNKSGQFDIEFGCMNDDFVINMFHHLYRIFLGSNRFTQVCMSTSADTASQKLAVLPETHQCFLYQDLDYSLLNDASSPNVTKCFTTFNDIYANGSSVEVWCYRGVRIVDEKIKLYGGCVDERRTCENLEGNSSVVEFFEKLPESVLYPPPDKVSCCKGTFCNRVIEPAEFIAAMTPPSQGSTKCTLSLGLISIAVSFASLATVL